jgi:hypothetical protein
MEDFTEIEFHTLMSFRVEAIIKLLVRKNVLTKEELLEEIYVSIDRGEIEEPKTRLRKFATDYMEKV